MKKSYISIGIIFENFQNLIKVIQIRKFIYKMYLKNYNIKNSKIL